jgi:hypothetical protein
MKKAALIIILVIVAAFVAFNFYAAHKASRELDHDIKMRLSASNTPVDVSYSKINITPFRANINFSDVKFRNKNQTAQLGYFQIDMNYIDFWRINISGLKKGMQHISSVKIHFKKGSYEDHLTNRKFSFAAANIKENGNLWSGLMALLKKGPWHQKHIFTGTASKLVYDPGDSLGIFKVDSARVHYIIPKANQGNPQPRDSIRFSHITWITPAYFHQNYKPMFKILGLPADSIPVAYIGCSFSALNQKHIEIKGGRIKTKPFTIKFHGTIIRDSTWNTARLAPLKVSIINLAPKLKNLLKNLGFFGSKKLNQTKSIAFRLVGPINNIQFKQGK